MATQGCTRVDFLPNPLDWPLRPLRGPCSGGGNCLDLGIKEFCICEDGYDGRSDFFDTSGADCQINLTAIRVLWALQLVVALVYFGRSVPKIRARFAQYREKQRDKQLHGKSYPVWRNRGLVAMLVHTFFVPALFIFPILKLTRPDHHHVGLDFTGTFFYAIPKAQFYVTAALFQPSLIASIVAGQRGTRRIVKINFRLSNFLSSMGVIVAMLPFITLAASDGRDSTATAVFYAVLGGTAIQVTGLGMQAFWTHRQIVTVLTQSVMMGASSGRTQEIKDALVKFQRESIAQAFLNASVSYLFILPLLPGMANSHPYWMPINYLAFSIIGFKLASTTVVDKKVGSSNATGNPSSSSTGGGATGIAPTSFHATSKEIEVSKVVSGDDPAEPSFTNVRTPSSPFPDTPQRPHNSHSPHL